MVDFNQVVSDKFITKEKANGYFDVFICYFAIKKITKDEIYLKLKKNSIFKRFYFKYRWSSINNDLLKGDWRYEKN